MSDKQAITVKEMMELINNIKKYCEMTDITKDMTAKNILFKINKVVEN